MSNQLLTSQEITWDSLEILENNCVIVPNFCRDLDQEFGKKGGKIGDTIFMRKPVRSIGRDGQAYSPEALVDTEVPITINQQSGDDFEFSTAEKFLSIDDFRRRYLKPKMIGISNKLDFRCATMAAQNTANLVGTPGVTPGLSSTDAFQIYSQAGQKLDERGFPVEKTGKGNRNLAINSGMRTGWNTYTKQFFNSQDSLTKQWKTGQIDNALGFQWMVDENVYRQTIGALGGTPRVNGAGQTGTAMITDGWSNSIAGLLNVGDVVSYDGVYNVNPQTRVSDGSLFQQVVQATAASDGSGNSTLSLMPALVPSGQSQNATGSPADNALINVYNTAAAGQGALAGVVTVQGLLWTPEAYAFVSFPGDVPEGTDMAFQDQSPDIGVSLRFVRIFDGYRDQWVNRFDVYYGIGPLYMEGGVRIAA